MTRKKKAAPAADALVAASAILIDGKHFDDGEEVSGVSEESLRQVVAMRRVIKAADHPKFAAQDPAGEPEGEDEPEDDGEPES